MKKVDGIILAAGFSRRMGKDKLLLPFEDEVVVKKIIDTCKKSDISKIIMVYRNWKVGQIGKEEEVMTVRNKRAYLGQSESVKEGLRHSFAEGYLFLAADQPMLSKDTINDLIGIFRGTDSGIIVPSHCGQVQMPILFSADFRDELMDIEGENGGAEIIRENRHKVHWYRIKDPLEVADIDTMDQYLDLIKRKGSQDDGV